MNASRIGTLIRLELLQRLRSVAWYVLLGIFALIMLVATGLSFVAFGGVEWGGSGVYSTVVYIVLLLTVLVAPTLSGSSINGDRDAATLAPVQVTLATTGDIITAKVLAAWITGVAFVVLSAPFLLVATLSGGVEPLTIVVSLVILLLQIGFVAAVGVGLSGLLARPLFSVAATYLVVAALTVGTPIAFGLVGASIQSDITVHSRDIQWTNDGMPVCADGSDDCVNDPTSESWVCDEWQTRTDSVPRFDRVWWMLAANPFVILADAIPVTYNEWGSPNDLFGSMTLGIRSAQQPPELEQRWDSCAPYVEDTMKSPREIIDGSTPSWFVGLGLQALIAAGLLWGAWARTRTPSRRTPPGTRIA